MPNVTISLDENLVKQARIKAIQEGTSLSAKVREMLAAYVRQDAPLHTHRHSEIAGLQGTWRPAARH